MNGTWTLSMVRRSMGAATLAKRSRRGARGIFLVLLIASAVLLLPVRPSCSVELPEPVDLKSRAGIAPQTIKVVEPHVSRGEHQEMVEYLGFPMEALLRDWFREAWRAPDAELVFQAADGYRSVIAGGRLQRNRAYLAFARADGQAFVVDNPAQNQKAVPLAPYYLIWDNASSPELQAQGTHGWPYQVTRIELRTAADDRALLPRDVSQDVKAGFIATKDHCLTCHRLRGVGGAKYPGDLERSVCGWSDQELAEFIAEPALRRPGTTMPALGGKGDEASRRQTIRQIVAYLDAVKAENSSCR